MTTKQLTMAEHLKGYTICECGKFAHIFRSDVLRLLPEGYSGECCPWCKLWMCDVSKINGGALADSGEERIVGTDGDEE